MFMQLKADYLPYHKINYCTELWKICNPETSRGRADMSDELSYKLIGNFPFFIQIIKRHEEFIFVNFSMVTTTFTTKKKIGGHGWEKFHQYYKLLIKYYCWKINNQWFYSIIKLLIEYFIISFTIHFLLDNMLALKWIVDGINFVEIFNLFIFNISQLAQKTILHFFHWLTSHN